MPKLAGFKAQKGKTSSGIEVAGKKLERGESFKG